MRHPIQFLGETRGMRDTSATLRHGETHEISEHRSNEVAASKFTAHGLWYVLDRYHPYHPHEPRLPLSRLNLRYFWVMKGDERYLAAPWHSSMPKYHFSDSHSVCVFPSVYLESTVSYSQICQLEASTKLQISVPVSVHNNKSLR